VKQRHLRRVHVVEIEELHQIDVAQLQARLIDDIFDIARADAGCFLRRKIVPCRGNGDLAISQQRRRTVVIEIDGQDVHARSCSRSAAISCTDGLRNSSSRPGRLSNRSSSELRCVSPRPSRLQLQQALLVRAAADVEYFGHNAATALSASASAVGDRSLESLVRARTGSTPRDQFCRFRPWQGIESAQLRGQQMWGSLTLESFAAPALDRPRSSQRRRKR